MAERKYSVYEIDRMRWSITLAVIGNGRIFHGAGECEAIVESRLRTYMQNGTDPDELAAHYAKESKP